MTHQAKEATDGTSAVDDVETSKTNDARIIMENFHGNNNNKKKREEDDDDEGDGANSTRPAHTNNNKRRKNKKGGKNNNKKKQHHKNNKQKRNWIESCSDSINRIPSNCMAPLTCVITRSEIEEEPLLPNQQVNGGVDTGAVVRNENVPTKTLDQDVGDTDVSTTEAKENSLSTDHSRNNIAILSKSYVDALLKESRQPWKEATTVKDDDNGTEEKKLFIPVQRHHSAIGPTKWHQRQKKQRHNKKGKGGNYCHLPDGDNGDGKKNPYPKDLVPDKFWAQRKRLFSRYDEGIQIGGKDDPEMWYSVTPESIGNHIAKRMLSMMETVQRKETIVIVDLFCGCGGNSIAFARLNSTNMNTSQDSTRVKVIAVDNCLSRLQMTANNALVYGISREDIILVHADAIEVVNAYNEGLRKVADDINPTNEHPQVYSGFTVGGVELLPRHVDAFFLSPPWGGVDYCNPANGHSGFDLVKGVTLESKIHNEEKSDDDTILKTNGGELLSMSIEATLNQSKQHGLVVVFLPRNIDGVSVSRVAATSGIKGSMELEQNVVNGKVKTVTAYIGAGVNEYLSREESTNPSNPN